MDLEEERTGTKSKNWILNESNYYSWAIRMKALLQRKECWEAIDGYDDIERDANGEIVYDDDGQPKVIIITAKERIRRRKMELLARELIYEKIPDAIHEEVEGYETAKLTWDHLAKAHTELDFIYEVQMLRELFAIKKTDGVTAQEYVKKISDLHRTISKSLEITLSGKALAGIAIAGLPEKYDSMVRVMDKTKLDLTYVKTQIHQEDLANKMKEKDSQEEAQALVVQKRTQHNQHQKNKNQDNKNNEKKNDNKNDYEKNDDASKNKRANAVFDSKNNREEVALCVSEGENMASKNVWILDNAASNHMTSHKELFIEYQPCKDYVHVADDFKLDVIGKGTVILRCVDQCGGKDVRLSNVYHIPSLDTSLLSMGQIDECGHKILVQQGRIDIYGKNTEKLFLSAMKKGTLWYVYTLGVTEEEIKQDSETQMAARVTLDLWHRRFAHCNQESLLKIPQLGLKRAPKQDSCDVCVEAKIINPPFPKKSAERSEKPLDLIHSDVGGKYKPKSLGQGQYYVTFIDDYSQYNKVYILKSKDEVFDKFKEYQAEVELYHECHIKALQCDNGTEYINEPFIAHLKKKGIRLFRSVRDQTQQNGKSERMNRTLMSTVRCMLVESGLPKTFWAEALRTASIRDAGIVNAKKLDSQAEKCVNLGIPENVKGYRLWSIGRQKVITSRTVVFTEHKFPFKKNKERKEKSESEESNDEDSEFLSSGEEEEEPEKTEKKKEEEETEKKKEEKENTEKENEKTENNEEKEQEEKKTEEKNDTEKKREEETENAEKKKKSEKETEDQEFDIFEGMEREEEEEEQIPKRKPRARKPKEKREEEPVLRRSSRIRILKKVCDCEDCDVPNHKPKKKVAYNVRLGPSEPQSYEEAIESHHTKEWKKSMREEMENMKKHEAWEIVPRPEKKNIIGSKWVYKIKKNENGDIVKYKSRLVGQGFSQVKGVDYKETYPPVLIKKSIKILLSIAVEKGFKTRHIDVLSAYLNSHIKEEVYMEQPKGFQEGENPKEFVCRLRRSIYGLHQSGRDWSMYITAYLKELGFSRCVNEPCIFHKKGIILGLYVDDALVIETEEEIEDFIKNFGKKIGYRDLGEVKCMLSLNVQRKENGLIVSQESYAAQLLHEYGMTDAVTASSPLPLNMYEEEYDEKPIYITTYRQAIGSLLYLSNNTRPDLAFAICALSQKCSKPTEKDWTNVIQVMKYLKTTMNIGLHFVPTREPLTVYVDSSWANASGERKSIYGVLLLLAGSAISWYAKKSKRVANSVLQAEYIAMDEGVREVLWVQHLFEELEMSNFVPKPTVIFGDNQGAIGNATKHGITERTKHFDTMLSFQRECCENGEIVFKYIESSQNLADALTKSLSGPKIKSFRQSIRLLSP
ncbi:hypothetical protein ONE63_011517 [Megalurothrips usitatus]|uniref:Integrase catalytic domain-containing protein n=1 Tax=Megalurothrips usitatus TaxID=439358 RepID=A0AAV7X5G3_9NEOP|nr:hypothetical protein ONE63_011517 [Megalurothrips usitatus]